MPLHILSQIDLEDKIAFCSICLWTEIHVPNSRPGKVPKPFCLKRWHEKQEYQKQVGKTRYTKRVLKPHHLLSKIDPINRIATCSVCGTAPIRKQDANYICANLARANERKSRRNYYKSRSISKKVHILAQIDEGTKTAICSRCGVVEIYIYQTEEKTLCRCSNAPVTRIPGAMKIRQEINTDIINRFKIRHSCKSCGTRANHDALDLCSKNPKKKAPNIKKLLKLNRAELMQKLSECDVLCLNCYAFPKKEYCSALQLTP